MTKKELLAQQANGQAILDQLANSQADAEKRVQALELEIEELLKTASPDRAIQAMELGVDLDHEKASLRRVISSPMREKAYEIVAAANRGLAELADVDAVKKAERNTFDELLNDLEAIWVEMRTNITLLEGLRSRVLPQQIEASLQRLSRPTAPVRPRRSAVKLAHAKVDVRFMESPPHQRGRVSTRSTAYLRGRRSRRAEARISSSKGAAPVSATYHLEQFVSARRERGQLTKDQRLDREPNDLHESPEMRKQSARNG